MNIKPKKIDIKPVHIEWEGPDGKIYETATNFREVNNQDDMFDQLNYIRCCCDLISRAMYNRIDNEFRLGQDYKKALRKIFNDKSKKTSRRRGQTKT